MAGPADPAKQVAEGRRLLAAQRFAEASEAFGKLLENKKHRASALLGLAEVAFQEQKYDRAAQRARQAAHAQAGPRAYDLLGDASFRLGRYPDAVSAWQKVLDLEPASLSVRDKIEKARKRM